MLELSFKKVKGFGIYEAQKFKSSNAFADVVIKVVQDNDCFSSAYKNSDFEPLFSLQFFRIKLKNFSFLFILIEISSTKKIKKKMKVTMLRLLIYFLILIECNQKL